MAPKSFGVVVRDMTVEIEDGRSKRVILDELTLTSAPGQITAFTGPSGCGKTTALSCLAGVATFQSGGALVGGQFRQPDRLATADELREIGIIFQDYRLMKSLSAVDNVALTLRLQGVRWRRARNEARRLLSAVGLDGRGDDRPSSMSGGEQQRVALARAVIGKPEVLLADEPSAHLDKDSAEMLIDLLVGLARRDVSIVVSTHDQRLLEVCDQVVAL